ncbi:hypothetical protein [Leeuwenhoekiella sp. NPDC079379]|uniref:hypothetical protein n=1 Tax=Leeuwenhoekiella sp. NPDC079379 TaxID=3364122 RepID=UPI0037C6596C
MHIKFGILILIAIATCSCGSSKKSANEEFVVEDLKRVDFNDKGFEVTFKVEALNPKITLNHLYFQNQKAQVTNSSAGIYSAQFAALKLNSEDRVLSLDMSKESKNSLPSLPVKMPVKIEESQALLSYLIDSNVKYKVLNFNTK